MLSILLLCAAPSLAPAPAQEIAGEFLETLDGALAGMPVGRYAFQVDRDIPAAPDGLDQALSQHRLASWLHAYRSVTGEESPPEEARQSIEYQVDQFVRGALEQPPVLEQWPPRFTLDVNSGFAEYRGPMLPPEGAGPDASASKIIIFLPDEVITVLSTISGLDRGDRRSRQAFRERATGSDVEQRDNTGYLGLVRTFPRKLLDAVAARPDGWSFERADSAIVARYEVTAPTHAFPPIGLYDGVEFGAVEATLDPAQGFLTSVVITDNLGLVIESYSYGEIVSDARGALPLFVRHETRYPVDGSPLRKSREFRGEVSPPPSRPTPLAALLSPGTHVEDLRVTPSVSYTQGLLPIDDAIVFERSAAAAGEIEHTDFAVAAEAAESRPRSSPPTEPSGLSTGSYTPEVSAHALGWNRSAVASLGALALALGFASLVGVRPRRRRAVRVFSSLLHLGLGALALLHVARAEGPVRAASPTGIRVLGQTELDLGLVRAGDKHPVAFELYNPTPDSIVLRHVTTTCGCTIVQPDRSVLEPGTSMKLAGGIDTAYDGERYSEIYVELEGVEEPLRVGSVRFEVSNRWRPSFRMPVLVAGSSNPPLHYEHREPVAPADVVASCDLPGVDIAPRLIDTQLWLDVSLDGAVLPRGEYEAEIAIETPEDDRPFLHTVRIRNKPEGYSTSPRSIVPDEGFLMPGQEATLSFRVLRDGRLVEAVGVRLADEGYELRDVRCEGAHVRLTLAPLGPFESSQRVSLDVELEDAVLRIAAYLPFSKAEEGAATNQRGYKTVSGGGQ